MTRHSAAALKQHAGELARAFGVRLAQSDDLPPDQALAIAHLRLAVVSTIVDETTYAVALHEMGHVAAPCGALRTPDDCRSQGLLQTEEDAAWTWARHYALEWTPVMEALAQWAEGTYHPATTTPPVPAAPTAPVVPKQQIDWSQWK